jgi:uncharacterized phage protein (TIGR02218 family)
VRSLPPTLAQKLDFGVTTLAYAWRLTRVDGVSVAVTQHDQDLTFDSTLFVAAQGFIGGDHEREVSLASDRTALSGALKIGAISEADLALGRWDQAKVEAFWVDWTNPADFIPMWTGIVAGASWRGSLFELDIAGPETLLNGDIGRVYARTCDAVLGDARCKVDLAAVGRTISATIANVVSDRTLTIALPAGKASSDFVGGVFKFVNGLMGAWTCDIARIDVNAMVWQLSLARPLPLAPQVGDAINITMGCDKAFATCKTRFANILNFRGQPTLPGDDVAFGGPAVSGNDGGKR